MLASSSSEEDSPTTDPSEACDSESTELELGLINRTTVGPFFAGGAEIGLAIEG